MKTLRCLVACLLIAAPGAVLVPATTLAVEVVGADRAPYALNNAFIDELWQAVISSVNAEAQVMRVPTSAKAPKIIYTPAQPEGKPDLLAEIEYAYNKSTRTVALEQPRTIYLYPRGFAVSPAIVYGAIVQEFFHEAMLHQEVVPEFQHCLMVSRGTLAKVLELVDQRLKTRRLAQKVILSVTFAQCESDMKKFIK